MHNDHIIVIFLIDCVVDVWEGALGVENGLFGEGLEYGLLGGPGQGRILGSGEGF